MDLLRSIVGSQTFWPTFAHLPYRWQIIAITVLAGMSEGVGLALFIPLIEIMGEGDAEPSRVYVIIRNIFEWLGLPMALITMLVAISFLIIGAFSLIYAQRVLVLVAKNRFVRDTRRTAAEQILSASWPFLARQSTGDLVNQLAVESNRAGLALMVQAYFIAAALQVVILIAMTAALSWQLVLIASGFAGVMIVVSRPLLRRAARLGDSAVTANKNYAAHLVDYLRGTKLIKITASENAVADRIDHFSIALFRIYRDYELNSALTNYVLQAVPVLMLASLIGVSQVVLGLDTASVLVVLLLLARIAPRIAEMQQRYENYKYNAPGFEAINQLKRSCAEGAEALNVDKTAFSTLSREIRVEDVSFQHDGESAVAVCHVNLRIGCNEMIAIVGSSGAGKSTMIDLIAGLYDNYLGQILVDGVELRDLDRRSYRKCIGYVTQDVIVFDDTLRNNLLFVRPDATDVEIESALGISHLSSVVAEMPQGLDTPLNEGGIRLSGGQRQRLALARTVLAQPALLLLDEATSSLDSETEKVVHQAIEALRHRLTVVVIAHRLSTVRNADHIYVMEGGRIVESGGYDELLARKGRFAQLHEFQLA